MKSSTRPERGDENIMGIPASSKSCLVKDGIGLLYPYHCSCFSFVLRASRSYTSGWMEHHLQHMFPRVSRVNDIPQGISFLDTMRARCEG
jgi:hypothetical protein